MAVELVITDRGNYEVLASNALKVAGHLARETTVATRCRFRLKIARGSWPYDPDLGSRLHTIRTLRQAVAEAEEMCVEALQDLIDDGDVTRVTLGDIHADPSSGHFAARVLIQTPTATVDLDMIPMGKEG